jgi:hypothetical protein
MYLNLERGGERWEGDNNGTDADAVGCYVPQLDIAVGTRWTRSFVVAYPMHINLHLHPLQAMTYDP